MSYIHGILLGIAMCLAGYVLFSAAQAYAEPMEQETVVIQYGLGGSVNEHVKQVHRWNSENTIVKIVGSCWSACTLYLSVNNVCTMPSASLHFHAPYYPSVNGGRRYGRLLTKRVYDFYPMHVRMWLDRQGGLGRDWLHFYGPMVYTAAPTCTD